MFQLLQPILLLSIAGIAIPVIIHLWNVQQSKTLKVGSISLLTQGKRQKASSLKLHELLLLFLRCVLIALLAFMVAEPIWRKQLLAPKEKGWILMEKENLQESYSRNKAQVDSLVKAGYEFHYFNTGFKKDDLARALKSERDTVAINPLSYWSLLKELNRVVASTLPVAVFVRNDLKRFSGAIPPVSLNLHLQTYRPADSVSTWIAEAFVTSADSIHLLIGHSKPSGTFCTQQNLSLSNLSVPGYRVEINKGKLMASLAAGEQEFGGADTSLVEVDTSTMRVTVFTDKFKSDANYIRAALECVRQFTGRKLDLSITNNYVDIQKNQDWLFWLSEQTVPSTGLAKNVFVYEKGKAKNIRSWLVTGDKANPDEQPVQLTRYISKEFLDEGSETIWPDGFGQPLLTMQVKNAISFYHFYSRFNPQWNDLPWSEEFPELMLKLIFFKGDDAAEAHDKRIIDTRQMQPYREAANKNVSSNKLFEQTDLVHFFWLAAFVLFMVERLLSFKNKKAIVYA